MADEQTSLTVSQQRASQLVALLQATNDRPALVPQVLLDHPTSLDISSDDGASKCLNCLIGGGHDLSDLFGVELEVTDYLLCGRDDGEPNESGETVYPALHLIMTDGNAVRITSASVCKGMPLLFALKGMGPWNPPLIVVVNEVKNKKTGRVYHSLFFPTRKGG